MKNSITLLLSLLAGHTHKNKKPSFHIGLCTKKQARAECNNCKMQFGAL